MNGWVFYLLPWEENIGFDIPSYGSVEGACRTGLHSRNEDCPPRGGRGELEAANPKGKRGRYHSSVLLPPKIRLYFMGVSTALEEISKLALNSSV